MYVVMSPLVIIGFGTVTKYWIYYGFVGSLCILAWCGMTNN